MSFFSPDTFFGSPSQTNPSTIDPSQQPFLERLFGRAEEASLGPNVSPTTQQGRQMALGAAQGLSPFINQAQQAQQFLTDPSMLAPENNPFLAQTAKAASRPILQALTEQILPNLRSGEAGAGQFGGTRRDIGEGIASRGALDAIGSASSNIFSQGFGQNLQAMLQGLSLAPQTAGLGLLPSQVFQDVGQQQQLDPFRNLGQLQSLLGPPIDRKSTRLNSSHRCISYAVFCLKKKIKENIIHHL